MKFTELMNKNFPEYAIRIKCGNSETYIGRNCRGLACLTSEQIAWLDSHKPVNVSYYFAGHEITLTYRKSATYHKIVWGF